MTARRKPTRRSKRNWGAYNASAIEPERVPRLLKSLCDGIEEETCAVRRTGQKTIPRREAIFGRGDDDLLCHAIEQLGIEVDLGPKVVAQA